MNRPQLDKIKTLVTTSPILSPQERTEWLALLELMNDKQMAELEKILESGSKNQGLGSRPQASSPPFRLPVSATPRPASPVAQMPKLPHIMNLPHAESSGRPAAGAVAANAQLQADLVNRLKLKAASQPPSGFAQKLKKLFAEKELTSSKPEFPLELPPPAASLPPAKPLSAAIPANRQRPAFDLPVPRPKPKPKPKSQAPAPILTRKSAPPPRLEPRPLPGPVEPKPVPEVVTALPPVTRPRPTPRPYVPPEPILAPTEPREPVLPTAVLPAQKPEPPPVVAPPPPVSRPVLSRQEPKPAPAAYRPAVQLTQKPEPPEDFPDFAENFESREAPAPALAPPAVLPSQPTRPDDREPEFNPGLVFQQASEKSRQANLASVREHVLENQPPTTSTTSTAISAEPAKSLGVKIKLDALADLPLLDAKNLRESDYSYLLQKLKNLISRSGYHEALFNLEKSPLYKAYLKTGMDVLSQGSGFEKLGNGYLSKQQFEKFTDLLRQIQIG